MRLSADDWQARLGVPHLDTDFHGRLQEVLYQHGLTLLRRGVDVILEDGLWMAEERTEKFRDARSCSARIELHLFTASYETLWRRLQKRNEEAASGSYPMSEAELRWAWDLFQPVSPDELSQVDSHATHSGGLA